MTTNMLLQLADSGLVPPGLAAEVQRIEAGGLVDMGDPLPLDDLFALAKIDDTDMAAAVADWDASSALPGLLDARAVFGIPAS